MVRELVRMMPEDQRNSPQVKEIAGYGCGTLMHIVRINARSQKNEDYLRDLDFTAAGVRRRWQAGYDDTMRTLERVPWETPIDPMVGVAVHDSDAPDQPSSLGKAG
jgi:NTE family protein